MQSYYNCTCDTNQLKQSPSILLFYEVKFKLRRFPSFTYVAFTSSKTEIFSLKKINDGKNVGVQKFYLVVKILNEYYLSLQ